MAKTKPAARKSVTRSVQTRNAKAKPEIIQAKTIPIKKPPTKRPPLTPAIPMDVIEDVINGLTQVKADLEEYAAHLRVLDRKRLNNIGVKREGFAQRAYRLAMDNPEFLPNYLAQERYTEDFDQYTIIQTAVDLNMQVRELLLNIDTEAMDFFYTDGLDFYASVREAAKRRVDAAESVHVELSSFFRRTRSSDAPETKKQQLRDAKGIIRGTRDGKFEAVNVKPKLSGGKHEVVDEQFRNASRFRKDIEGEVEE